MVDQRRVTHAEAEQEPRLPRVVPTADVRRDVGGLVHPDVEDARRDDRTGCGAQQRLDGAEHVAADVGDPQRVVAQLVELGRDSRRSPPGSPYRS